MPQACQIRRSAAVNEGALWLSCRPVVHDRSYRSAIGGYGHSRAMAEPGGRYREAYARLVSRLTRHRGRLSVAEVPNPRPGGAPCQKGR